MAFWGRREESPTLVVFFIVGCDSDLVVDQDYEYKKVSVGCSHQLLRRGRPGSHRELEAGKFSNLQKYLGWVGEREGHLSC